MNKGRAAKAAKSARKDSGLTQLQLSMDIDYSREAVSKQEHGEYRVQPELAKHYTTRHQNPWVAMEAAHEYTGWGPVKLDGDLVDLHRSSVKAKAIEELQEAIDAIENIDVVNHPNSLASFERKNVEDALEEVVEAITASNHLVAVLCAEYAFKWDKVWSDHTRQLKAKGYVKS
ncbi:XRE family transcriptional regulator [Pontibacillus salipaludis]|uniref:HTH cro/C1-type domain-containing protein n=1 Tax=Pontibacillus salipaludis TaxID=1697394 RepID=A0ABQ1PW33_9BACI|nr:XRE family transcriptional regulator [Pontibacillus salipaludis]GGD05146.1 hypothetical protein GCM10011389_10800 [Pontibacillus salipaludis]